MTKWLITGGTGSLGQAVTRHILDKEPDCSIRIYSRNEYFQVEMERTFNDKRLRFLIGDVRDKDRLSRACNGIDNVIHCAALKHVPVCEYNPIEAVKTNINGTVNIIDACIDNNVKKCLAISTDKAVNPINLYGGTKLVAEKLLTYGNIYGNTMFSCVRFGNFIGSSGSVIPLFLKQKSEGKITITDENMIRYWIGFNEAVQFIYKFVEVMEGKEIFIPKMERMSVKEWIDIIAPEAEQVVTGIRDGEKLEELMYSQEEEKELIDCVSYFKIKVG